MSGLVRVGEGRAGSTFDEDDHSMANASRSERGLWLAAVVCSAVAVARPKEGVSCSSLGVLKVSQRPAELRCRRGSK